MIRRPAIPLLAVREMRARGIDPQGGDPHRFAKEQRARRHRERRSDQRRLGTLAFALVCGFCLIGGGVIHRTTETDASDAPRYVAVAPEGSRADIVDRNGLMLATNLPTRAVYINETALIDRKGVARKLAQIFPNLTPARVEDLIDAKGTRPRIVRRTSPAQQQAVMEIGDPGVILAPRQMRVYPNGHMLAPVLGRWKYETEDERGATLSGVSGIEYAFQDRLSAAETLGIPLALSIDLRVQQVMRDVLTEEMERLHARAAAGVLMDVHTGEIISMVSLPDFDPNQQVPFQPGVPAEDRVEFNRAVQGLYELGSTYKLFAIAQALEEGLVKGVDEMIPTANPIYIGGKRIRDHHYLGKELDVAQVLIKSSNIGTARILDRAESAAQQAFLKKLGLLDAAPVELPAAGVSRPLKPARWRQVERMTISFGHGVTGNLVHLASAYGAMVNGGLKVEPTLLKGAPNAKPPVRVISERTSAQLRDMLHRVMTEGTGRNANVAGYAIGGKTGSANKPDRVNGGYHEDKVISNMAVVFPVDNPRYVLTVLLDEPEDRTTAKKPIRTASYTSAPAAKQVMQRIFPILGLKPLPTDQNDAKPELIYASNRH